MDVAPSQPPADAIPRAAIGSFFFFLGGLVLWVLVSDYLDPPETWDRCSPPTSAELAALSAQREDFLLLTVPILAGYGIALAVCAWKWAADRRARQGRERRPGPLALGAAIGLGTLWALLIGGAFAEEKVGGSIFWGLVLAAASLVAAFVLALAVAAGAFRGDSQSEETAETLSVGFAWTLLFVGLPWLLLRIAIVGKDGTLWC